MNETLLQSVEMGLILFSATIFLPIMFYIGNKLGVLDNEQPNSRDEKHG